MPPAHHQTFHFTVISRVILIGASALSIGLTTLMSHADERIGASPPAATQDRTLVSLNSITEYRTAHQAMRDRLYGVAAENLRAVDAIESLTPDERVAVQVMLLEALVRDGKARDALVAASAISQTDDPAGIFWLAQAQAVAGRLAASAAAFDRYHETNDPAFRLAATMSHADVLLQLREPSAALHVVSTSLEDPKLSKNDSVWLLLKKVEILLVTSGFEVAESTLADLDASDLSPASALLRDYLSAQVHLGLGRFEQAAGEFGGLLNQEASTKLPPKVAGAAALGQAHASIGAGDRDAAILTLKKMIADLSVESPETLDAAFSLLAELGVFSSEDQGSPHEGDIREWVRSNRPRVAGLATYYQVASLLEGDPVEAWDLLGSYRQWVGPGVELAPPLLLLEAETLIKLGQFPPASKLLVLLADRGLTVEQETKRAFLLGQSAMKSGDYVEAQRAFASAALRAAPNVSAAANYNAAVAAMQNGLGSGFQQFLSNLKDNGSQSLAAQLLLERGIYLSEREPELARVAIWQYIRSFPRRAENARAYIVLAEIALRQSPPAPEKARNQLTHVPDSGVLSEDLEKRDYLLIWVADLEGHPAEAIKRATLFLDEWSDSGYADATRMKLAEVFFNSGDYVNARAQFEYLANHSSSPVIIERALFFAGRAASLSLSEKGLVDAIKLFQRVIDKDGRLLLRARREQAAILVRQGKIDDAIDLLDVVLEDNTQDNQDEHFDVLQQKGEILLTNRPNDKKALAGAEAAFQAMVNYGQSTSVGNASRYLAEGRFGLGRIAEVRGTPDKALTYYYAILESEAEPGTPPADAVVWKFRSGMVAVDLLMREKRWNAAALLAGRLGQLPHPRADEARDIAERIELNHFIWKDE